MTREYKAREFIKSPFSFLFYIYIFRCTMTRGYKAREFKVVGEEITREMTRYKLLTLTSSPFLSKLGG